MNNKVLGIFVTISLFVFSCAYADDAHYYLLADAGSTGTRIHLFKHDNNKTLPHIEDVFTEDNAIPLSSFEENPDKAFESIKPLLDDAVAKIHENHIKTPVGVSILGTAGMRMLTTDRQKDIYNAVKTSIANNYKDLLILEKIQTISGKMEGVYGWLDINYLLKNFHDNKPTAGSIDVGGVSTEIAFAMEKPSKSIDEVSVTINNVSYTVLSKSFLGLGTNSARNSMDIDDNAGYCYPKGYNNAAIKGSFNLSPCADLYNQVITNYHINQLALPTYKIPMFVVFSGAFYTFHFLGVDPKIPDQDTLEQTIILPTCSNSWEVLKEAYPAEPEEYLANYCNNSIFLSNLFYGAFQLQHQQIAILSSINEQHIDWTLGAMLYNVIKGEA